MDSSQYNMPHTRRRRHYFGLMARVATILRSQPHISELVSESYDAIAGGYDSAWTDHMRDLSGNMLQTLNPPAGARCLDLTCGTGYITSELANITGRRAIGVDGSSGMLMVAEQHHGDNCEFHHSDIVTYLQNCKTNSFDVITCGWGLGYSRPVKVVCEIARVVRPGGRVGIIDNSLFSLAGILWSSIQLFAESPEMLANVMNFRFLPGSIFLATMFRSAGIGVNSRCDGKRTYFVPDGDAAIQRLMKTGAAAGFEHAIKPEHREDIFGRFARLIEQKYQTGEGIPVTHRYLAVTGTRT